MEGNKQLILTRVTKAKLILSLLIFFMLFDYLIKDYLFWKSVDHIKLLRSYYSCKFFDFVCILFSELGDKYVVTFLIFLCYNTMDLSKSFTLGLVAASC